MDARNPDNRFATLQNYRHVWCRVKRFLARGTSRANHAIPNDPAIESKERERYRG